MSMILGGALMGLGQGLSKYADDLSEKAKATASSEQSLKTYRDKKNIDREFKGLPPIEAGMAVEDGRVKTSVSGPSSVRTGGAPRRSSGSPAQPASAPDTTPTATGDPSQPGWTRERHNELNPGTPAKPAGEGVTIPKGKPAKLTITGDHSDMAVLNRWMNDRGIKDPTLRRQLISDAARAKGANVPVVDFTLLYDQQNPRPDTENTGPTPAPGLSSDGPARGLDDPALNGATPSRPAAATPPPATVAPPSGGLTSIRDMGTRNTAPTPATTSIPQGAIKALLANPSLAGDFDAKYGAGSAAKYLR